MPVHVAGLAVRVSPARSVPAIVGSESGTGGSPTSRTSCGAEPPSFEVSTSSPAEFGVVSRNDTGVAPATALVTSTSRQELVPANGATVATSTPGAGALPCVRPLSVQFGDVAQTWKPVGAADWEKTRSVALRIPGSATSKRMKARFNGVSFTRMTVSVPKFRVG